MPLLFLSWDKRFGFPSFALVSLPSVDRSMSTEDDDDERRQMTSEEHLVKRRAGKSVVRPAYVSWSTIWSSINCFKKVIAESVGSKEKNSARRTKRKGGKMERSTNSNKERTWKHLLRFLCLYNRGLRRPAGAFVAQNSTQLFILTYRQNLKFYKKDSVYSVVSYYIVFNKIYFIPRSKTRVHVVVYSCISCILRPL